MGFQFYVCEKCGEVHCESDLGKHQDECKNSLMGEEDKKKLEKAIKKEFGDDYYISERHLCYFNSFWDAFDFWQKNYENNDKKDECKNNADYVKLFLWHGHYGPTKSLSEWNGPKQSKSDIKTMKKIGMILI